MNDDLFVCNDGKPMTILLSFYVMVDLVQPGLKTKVTINTKKKYCRLWLTWFCLSPGFCPPTSTAEPWSPPTPTMIIGRIRWSPPTPRMATGRMRWSPPTPRMITGRMRWSPPAPRMTTWLQVGWGGRLLPLGWLQVGWGGRLLPLGWLQVGWGGRLLPLRWLLDYR